MSRERSYPMLIYWYHSKGDWLRYNFTADSFYSAPHYKCCTSYGNSVRQSVRLAVLGWVRLGDKKVTSVYIHAQSLQQALLRIPTRAIPQTFTLELLMPRPSKSCASDCCRHCARLLLLLLLSIRHWSACDPHLYRLVCQVKLVPNCSWSICSKRILWLYKICTNVLESKILSEMY